MPRRAQVAIIVVAALSKFLVDSVGNATIVLIHGTQKSGLVNPQVPRQRLQRGSASQVSRIDQMLAWTPSRQGESQSPGFNEIPIAHPISWDTRHGEIGRALV